MKNFIKFLLCSGLFIMGLTMDLLIGIITLEINVPSNEKVAIELIWLFINFGLFISYFALEAMPKFSFSKRKKLNVDSKIYKGVKK